MSLYQLIYISSATGPMSIEACREIVRTSQRNNARQDVTGLLLFNSRRFLQVLEGPQVAVETLFTRIRDDARHRAVVTLGGKFIEEREFGAWAMAFDDPAQAAPDVLKDKLATLLARTSPSTRALFQTTADLHRTA